MADIVRYVNTASSAGGDGTTNATTGANRAYASLNEWEAAEQTDLVTDTDTHTVYCSGSTDDTTATIILGWTTSSTYDITIETTQANRHSGVWNADKYILDIDNGISLTIQEDFVDVIGLQIKGHGATTHTRKCITVSGLGSGSDVQISNCILYYAAVSGAYSFGLHADGDNTIVTANNCLIYGDVVASAGLKCVWSSSAADTAEIHLNNVTMARAKFGAVAYDLGEIYCKNVLATDITSEEFYEYETDTMYIDYSAGEGTDVTSYGGTGNRASQTFTFETGADNFHLASNDAGAKDYGTSSGFSYSDDIDGDTRSGSWDIGCDENTSTGTTHEAAGTSSAESSASGVVKTIRKIAGSTGAVSSVTGAAETVKEIAGSCAAESSITGSVKVTREVSGSCSAESSATAAAITTSVITVAGIAEAQSSASGAVKVTREIAGSISAESSATGTTKLIRELSGSVSAESTVTAAASLGAIETASGTSEGVSNVSGSVKVVRKVSGTVTTESSAMGTASLGGEELAAGTAAAQSGATGSVKVIRKVSGTVSAESAASGTAALGGEELASGTVTAESGVTGTAKVVRKAAGTVNAVSTASGTAEATGEVLVSGSVAAESTAQGTVKIVRLASGEVVGVTNVNGAVVVYYKVSGTVEAVSFAEGTAVIAGEGICFSIYNSPVFESPVYESAVA